MPVCMVPQAVFLAVTYRMGSCHSGMYNIYVYVQVELYILKKYIHDWKRIYSLFFRYSLYVISVTAGKKLHWFRGYDRNMMDAEDLLPDFSPMHYMTASQCLDACTSNPSCKSASQSGHTCYLSYQNQETKALVYSGSYTYHEFRWEEGMICFHYIRNWIIYKWFCKWQYLLQNT